MSRRRDIVLVVDDDFAVRASFKFALELEGFAVRICGSGEELLIHPDLRKAQCILLDYRMPEMDGFAVLDRLVACKVDAPVIFMTSGASGVVRSRARAAGACHVLEKPLLDGILLHTIQDILGNRPVIPPLP